MHMTDTPHDVSLPGMMGLVDLRNRYLAEIRPHPYRDTLGVIKHIKNMIARDAITIAQIETAISHYSDYVTRERVDVRFRKHIRSFFTPVVILQWQRPLEKHRGMAGLDPAITPSVITPRAQVAAHPSEEVFSDF